MCTQTRPPSPTCPTCPPPQELLGALSHGAASASGWLATCQLLLEDGAAEAALDAAKQVRGGWGAGGAAGRQAGSSQPQPGTGCTPPS